VAGVLAFAGVPYCQLLVSLLQLTALLLLASLTLLVWYPCCDLVLSMTALLLLVSLLLLNSLRDTHKVVLIYLSFKPTSDSLQI
jgi:hypothetical protein